MTAKLLDIPGPYVGRHRPDEGGKWHVPVAAASNGLRVPKHARDPWVPGPLHPNCRSVWDRVLDDGHPPGFLGKALAELRRDEAQSAVGEYWGDPVDGSTLTDSAHLDRATFDTGGPIPPMGYRVGWDRNSGPGPWLQGGARFTIDSPYWRRDDDGVTRPVGIDWGENEQDPPSWWRRFVDWWEARLYGFLVGIGAYTGPQLADGGWVTEPNDDAPFTVEGPFTPDWLAQLFPDGVAAQLVSGDQVKLQFDRATGVTRAYIKMQSHVMIPVSPNTDQCVECGGLDMEPDFDVNGPCWVELIDGGDD